MMNCITLVGRLCADPDIRNTTTGKVVAGLRIAVDRRGREKETDFFEASAFGQTASFAGDYLRKGRLVAIVGKLRTREYEAKDGTKRKVYEILVDDLTPLDKAKEGDPGGFTASSAAPKPVADSDIEDPFAE
jgi:single-strand DNA-binding protein